MQVFFAWVAAQKLSSCKQRIITSCTSGLHNKRCGSTHYGTRLKSRGNLIAIFIAFILQKIVIFHYFLAFLVRMCYHYRQRWQVLEWALAVRMR